VHDIIQLESKNILFFPLQLYENQKNGFIHRLFFFLFLTKLFAPSGSSLLYLCLMTTILDAKIRTVHFEWVYILFHDGPLFNWWEFV